MHCSFSSYLVFACAAYLSPLLRRLAPYVSFSVDSTVAHYAHLTDVAPTSVEVDAETYAAIAGLPQPVQQRMKQHAAVAAAPPSASPLLRAWQLPTHDLKNLIGSVGEWNTQSPLVDSSMELMVYIPPKDQRPLFFSFPSDAKQPGSPLTHNAVCSASCFIAGLCCATHFADCARFSRVLVHRAVSLVVPRFGGVLILNSPGNCTAIPPHACSIDTDHTARDIMQLFVQQMRQALALNQRKVSKTITQVQTQSHSRLPPSLIFSFLLLFPVSAVH